jgi:hypothetical protein
VQGASLLLPASGFWISRRGQRSLHHGDTPLGGLDFARQLFTNAAAFSGSTVRETISLLTT